MTELEESLVISYIVIAIVFIGGAILLVKLIKAAYHFVNPSEADIKKRQEIEKKRKDERLEIAKHNREIELQTLKRNTAKKSVEVKATNEMIQSLVNQYRDNFFINNRITIGVAEKIAEAFYLEICEFLEKIKTLSNESQKDIPFYEIGNRVVYVAPMCVCSPTMKKWIGNDGGTIIDFEKENLTWINERGELEMFSNALRILSRELLVAEYQKNPTVCTIQNYDLTIVDKYIDATYYEPISKYSISFEFKFPNPYYVANPPKQWY